MARWAMVIHLQRCYGCYACQIACKQEHFLPPGIFWNRLLIGETGKYPTVTKQLYPVQCNHCQNPACVDVCPTGATLQREDGIVIIDGDKCVGCRYCVIACPYQQRTFYGESREYFPGQGLTPLELLGAALYPLKERTVVKCNFCVERIDRGTAIGLTPGLDREATPACVNVCTSHARYFGDLDDPESQVSRLIREKKALPLRPDLDTLPTVYYIQR